jgi:hypothetical protein
MEELKPKIGFIDEYGLLPAVIYALNENKVLMLTGETGTGIGFGAIRLDNPFSCGKYSTRLG